MYVEFLKDFLTHPTGQQIQVADDIGQDLIAKGYAREIPDPTNGIVDRAVAAAAQRLSQSMDQVITEALKEFQKAQGQARKHAIPALFGEGNTGDPQKNFGDFCLAVARGDTPYLEKHYGTQFISYSGKAALAEASGITGGYLVPAEFYKQLMEVMEEETFLRQRAFVVPMGSATLQIPYLDSTTTPTAGTSPFFGGLKLLWTEEAATRTETEPKFRMLVHSEQKWD